MSANPLPIDLVTTIQQLLDERREHEAAIARINQTLGGVGAALGADGAGSSGAASSGAGTGRRPVGRPRKVEGGTPSPAADQGRSSGGKRKRGRRTYSTTGEESILGFVKDNRNPTTQDIKAHWASEGRLGTADNVLSKLYRENRIKRTPLLGQRGSRYSVV